MVLELLRWAGLINLNLGYNLGKRMRYIVFHKSKDELSMNIVNMQILRVILV